MRQARKKGWLSQSVGLEFRWERRLMVQIGLFEQRRKLHLRHQHQPLVGDADFRDHRQRDQIESHVGNGAPGFRPFDLELPDFFRDFSDPFVRKQACDRQGIVLYDLRTDEPLERALFDLLSARLQRGRTTRRASSTGARGGR